MLATCGRFQFLLLFVSLQSCCTARFGRFHVVFCLVFRYKLVRSTNQSTELLLVQMPEHSYLGVKFIFHLCSVGAPNSFPVRNLASLTLLELRNLLPHLNIIDNIFKFQRHSVERICGVAQQVSLDRRSVDGHF